MNTSCPRCGGTDRFYYVPNPRKGGPPFWKCRQCHHVERSSGDTSMAREAIHHLSHEERQLAQRGYGTVADWCATYLWTAHGLPALTYLRSRGFTDQTIHDARLGYHPLTHGYAKTGDAAQDWGVSSILYHRDPEAHAGSILGGLLGPQGRPKWPLRDSITIPYFYRGVCTMLRMRKLVVKEGGKRYFSPSGVELYAGGRPTLYGADLLDNATIKEVLLDEGEFKALLAQQHGLPAVAQPGISYLPPAFVEALAGKTVIIGYDVEARKNPFELSPGERFTIQAVERMTGIALRRTLKAAKELADGARVRAKTGDPDEQSTVIKELTVLDAQLQTLGTELRLIDSLRLRVKVLRKPRASDEPKIDTDGFILRHGADRLKALMLAAPEGVDWHKRHSGGDYRFEKGGISNGKDVANYQARIIETIYQNDGMVTTAVQRLALRAPSGQIITHDILDQAWADDRSARTAIRVGLREGTFDDDPREILRAIRILSSQGDPPVARTEYTATGWEQINDHWHFLSSDGAVSAKGLDATIRAELDPALIGNHYALGATGDAATGATAWLKFLRGGVCTQHMALILAAQAVLPLIHRFSDNSARTMVWMFHQSGALKTALTRASVMALYGPKFTAERADGAPVPKWDSTGAGLGLLVFFYRDVPLLIDDYKQGMISLDQLKKFIHNYSESTGRTRATKTLGIDRIRPARGIVFSTAEDLPSIGDAGMDARLLALQLHPSSTNPDALAELQRAGSAGHLVAFWRGFIQHIASNLDNHGESGVRDMLRTMAQADDEALPGHKRMGGSLRQNRLAWLVISNWLKNVGYISKEEAAQLNAAHLETRSLLAQSLTERQHENRPGMIFLTVLSELVQSGDLIIERPGMTCARCGSAMTFTDQAWYCTGMIGPSAIPCPYHIRAEKVIGFTCEDGSIGLFAEKAFQAVSRVRTDQRQPFAFSSTAIWQQLDADGLVKAKDKDGRYQVQRRNPARLDARGYAKAMRVLQLTEGCLDADRVEGVEIMGSMGSMGSKTVSVHQDAELVGVGHGIKRDQTPHVMGSKRTTAQPHGIFDPIDPIRSHAWDQEFTASQCATPDLDPIDPMISTPTTHYAPAPANPLHKPKVNLVRPAEAAATAVAPSPTADLLKETRDLLREHGTFQELKMNLEALSLRDLTKLHDTLRARTK